MLEMLKDLPDGVVGVEAKGKVTASNYETVLVPAIDDAKDRYGKVRFLFIIGDDYDGFSLGAAWDDMKLGVQHLRSFERIALVTDKGWLRHSIRVFGWMVPGEVSVFGAGELAAAREWVAS